MGQLQSQIYTKNNSLIRKELDSMLNHSDSDRTEHSNAKCLKEFFIEIQTRAQDAIKMKILVTQLGGHVKDKREYRNLIQNTWEKKGKLPKRIDGIELDPIANLSYGGVRSRETSNSSILNKVKT